MFSLAEKIRYVFLGEIYDDSLRIWTEAHTVETVRVGREERLIGTCKSRILFSQKLVFRTVNSEVSEFFSYMYNMACSNFFHRGEPTKQQNQRLQ